MKKKSVVKFNLKGSEKDKQVGQAGEEEKEDGELINRSL